jgi:hypothetical protein
MCGRACRKVDRADVDEVGRRAEAGALELVAYGRRQRERYDVQTGHLLTLLMAHFR